MSRVILQNESHTSALHILLKQKLRTALKCSLSICLTFICSHQNDISETFEHIADINTINVSFETTKQYFKAINVVFKTVVSPVNSIKAYFLLASVRSFPTKPVAIPFRYFRTSRLLISQSFWKTSKTAISLRVLRWRTIITRVVKNNHQAKTKEERDTEWREVKLKLLKW